MDNNIISALNAGSGIDTTKLVKQLVEVEKAPQQNRIDSKKEQIEAKISAYGTLKSSLSEFQQMLKPLSENDTFNARSVSFPETDVITPDELKADAQTGAYQIEVLEVAQSQALAANTSYSDKEAALNASGELTIRLGQWSYDGGGAPLAFTENEEQASLSINVAADDSLQDIADKINAKDSDVQASVLLVDGNYQLMMTAPSGAKNALEITGNDPSLDNFSFNAANHANVTETQKAQDAKLKVNGLTVYRDSNAIEDVIGGLSFTINKASPGDKFTFSINEDKKTGETAIRNFVKAYNTFFETAKKLTGIQRNAETSTLEVGDLANDGAAKALVSQVRNMMTTAVPGLDSNGFSALTNIGIRTQLDGTLEITDEFGDAIKNNFDQIQKIFAPQVSSSSSYVDVSIGSYASKTVSGTYSGEVTTAPTRGNLLADNNLSGVTFPLDTSTGDYSFSVRVDGSESAVLALSGTYNSAEELRVGIQSLINNDSTLKDARAQLDVTLQGNTLALTSRQYGVESKVSLVAAGADFTAATGLSTSSATTNGVDAAGTIEGVAAFGAGNVLLPKIDTDPYGLNLTIREGASGSFSFNYSRGLAGEMSKLIDSFLKTDGALKNREDSLNKQLTGLSEDQENLNRKMGIFETRLTQQYLAMERIISGFSTITSSLDGILDRLPFTAKNK